MSLHPSARSRNVRATLVSYLAGLTITGAPSFDPTEVQNNSTAMGVGPWMRATVDLQDGEYSGLYEEGVAAHRVPVTVTIQLFWPSGHRPPMPSMPGQTVTVDYGEIDTAADEVADAFRHRHLPLLDYVGTPDNPPEVVGHRLMFRDPASPRQLPAQGPWRRRQIVADGEYIHRHTL
ncbi:MAG: hypothetical protein AAFV53_31750 [Myxococcota bacterium]